MTATGRNENPFCRSHGSFLTNRNYKIQAVKFYLTPSYEHNFFVH